jgi:hypothetical protein
MKYVSVHDVDEEFFCFAVHRQAQMIGMWKEGMKIEIKHVKR